MLKNSLERFELNDQEAPMMQGIWRRSTVRDVISQYNGFAGLLGDSD